MTLWLVGMMGSGKSSAGESAARHLGVDFYDTDRVVAERMGCSVAQLWGRRGETAFRDLEKVATSSLAGKEGIVSTGGGVVLDEGNRELITGSGVVIWLKASPSVLADRLDGHENRPLLSGNGNEEVLAEILAQREPLYRQVADHEIETDEMDVPEVADAIGAIWAA